MVDRSAEINMTVEQVNVVDVIGIDKRTGQVILTISDHLDWSDTSEHQAILQAKLNNYLAFVESGEIMERYPDAQGREVVFKVVFKFKPDPKGEKFLLRAREIIKSAGFELLHELFADSYDN